MGAVVVLVALLALLLVIGTGFLWQERRRLGEPGGAVVYGVEEALTYVHDRLSDSAKAALGRNDVRRLLEWSMRYLQDGSVRGPEEAAVAGSLESAAFAQEEAFRAGHTYDGALVLEVVKLQAAYLAEIGAVAEPVESATPDRHGGDGEVRS